MAEGNLDVDFEFISGQLPMHDEKYVQKFPMKKVPSFEAVDGWKLHECTAIAVYCKSNRSSLTIQT